MRSRGEVVEASAHGMNAVRLRGDTRRVCMFCLNAGACQCVWMVETHERKESGWNRHHRFHFPGRIGLYLTYVRTVWRETNQSPDIKCTHTTTGAFRDRPNKTYVPLNPNPSPQLLVAEHPARPPAGPNRAVRASLAQKRAPEA